MGPRIYEILKGIMERLTKLWSRRRTVGGPTDNKYNRNRRIFKGRRVRIDIKDMGGRLAYSDDEAVRTADEIVKMIRELPPDGTMRVEIFLVDERPPEEPCKPIIVPHTASQASPTVQLQAARTDETGEFAKSREAARAAILDYQRAREARGET